MNRSLLSYSLGTVLLTFGLAACGSDSTSPATSVTQAQEQADVATAAGDAAGEDVDVMFAMYANASGAHATEAAAVTRAPAFHARVAAGDEWHLGGPCPYDADSGRHVCPTVTNGQGLSLNRSYAFFDGTTAQEWFDASTTTSINIQASLFGTVTRQAWTATVDRSRDLTVTAGDGGWSVSRIWNGSGEGSLSADNDQGDESRSYRLNSSATVTDVRVAEPLSENPWPLSGSITYVFNGTRTREGATTVSKTVSYTATVTFNGTRMVPLDVGSGQFCIDLVTRELVDVTCR